MARKIRLTPFARFFIFLLIAAPLAFLGASYYRGEDGIAKIKSIIGLLKGETQTTEIQTTETPTTETPTTEIQPSEIQPSETEISIIPSTSDVINKASSNASELEAKLDAILQNQKRILEILESNQKPSQISGTDSL